MSFGLDLAARGCRVAPDRVDLRRWAVADDLAGGVVGEGALDVVVGIGAGGRPVDVVLGCCGGPAQPVVGGARVDPEGILGVADAAQIVEGRGRVRFVSAAVVPAPATSLTMT